MVTADAIVKMDVDNSNILTNAVITATRKIRMIIDAMQFLLAY